MFYDYAITVPANTAASDPVVERIQLCQGIIHRIEVHFPIGCHAMVHCRLFHEGAQQWPSNNQGSFATDGYAIVIDELFDLNVSPYQLIAKCWSPDTTYDHIVTVRVGVLRGLFAVGITRLLNNLSKFLQLTGVGG